MASRRCQTEICRMQFDDKFHNSLRIHNQYRKVLFCSRCFEWQHEVVLSAAEKRTNILQECHEAEKEIRQVGENAKNQRESE